MLQLTYKLLLKYLYSVYFEIFHNEMTYRLLICNGFRTLDKVYFKGDVFCIVNLFLQASKMLPCLRNIFMNLIQEKLISLNIKC